MHTNKEILEEADRSLRRQFVVSIVGTVCMVAMAGAAAAFGVPDFPRADFLKASVGSLVERAPRIERAPTVAADKAGRAPVSMPAPAEPNAPPSPPAPLRQTLTAEPTPNLNIVSYATASLTALVPTSADFDPLPESAADNATASVTIEPAQPVESPQPAATPVPVEIAKPIETTKPVETSKPIETLPPVETLKPIETSKPIDTPAPVETPKPIETPKPVERPKPVETAEAPEAPRLVWVPLPLPKPPPTPAQQLGLEGKERAKAEKCLAQAIYFEARAEAVRGQIAVAQVVLNRVFSPYYPKDICSVVYQNAHRHLACQFTFACDGKPEAIRERGAWARAQRIAKQTLDAKVWLPEVAKSTHYHAAYVRPRWVREMRKMVRYGTHTFYRPHRWGDGAHEPGWGLASATATAAAAPPAKKVR